MCGRGCGPRTSRRGSLVVEGKREESLLNRQLRETFLVIERYCGVSYLEDGRVFRIKVVKEGHVGVTLMRRWVTLGVREKKKKKKN